MELNIKSSYWTHQIIRLDDGTYLDRCYHTESKIEEWHSYATLKDVFAILMEDFK